MITVWPVGHNDMANTRLGVDRGNHVKRRRAHVQQQATGIGAILGVYFDRVAFDYGAQNLGARDATARGPAPPLCATTPNPVPRPPFMTATRQYVPAFTAQVVMHHSLNAVKRETHGLGQHRRARSQLNVHVLLPGAVHRWLRGGEACASTQYPRYAGRRASYRIRRRPFRLRCPLRLRLPLRRCALHRCNRDFETRVRGNCCPSAESSPGSAVRHTHR